MSQAEKKEAVKQSLNECQGKRFSLGVDGNPVARKPDRKPKKEKIKHDSPKKKHRGWRAKERGAAR